MTGNPGNGAAIHSGDVGGDAGEDASDDVVDADDMSVPVYSVNVVHSRKFRPLHATDPVGGSSAAPALEVH